MYWPINEYIYISYSYKGIDEYYLFFCIIISVLFVIILLKNE